MNSINQIEVVYHNRLVGRLALTKDNLCAFEYSAEWQNSGFSISPFELPLRTLRNWLWRLNVSSVATIMLVRA